MGRGNRSSGGAWPDLFGQQTVLVRAITGVLLAVVLISCNQGADGSANLALDIPGPAGLRSRKVPPGAEEVNMMVTFSNGSDRTVTLQSIEPVGGNGFGEVGEVVRIELARRDESLTELSTYGTYPPVVRRGKRCVVQETYPVEGYELGPGERVVIVVWWRALKEGRFRINGERVVYEVDGETHEQTVPFGIVGWINGKEDQLLEGGQRHCAGQVEILPGWRLPDSS